MGFYVIGLWRGAVNLTLGTTAGHQRRAVTVEHRNTPLGFDMSNFQQVRLDLENVDNVPLLVSLLTAWTAENATEMVHITQDYGEVSL